MEKLKKYLPFLAVYFVGVITTMTIFYFFPLGKNTSNSENKDLISLNHLNGQPRENSKDRMGIQRFKNNDQDINNLQKAMQRNFQDDDDDMMNQFKDMRKKMLQLLEEESGAGQALHFGGGALDEDRSIIADELKVESREDNKNYYFELPMEGLDQSSLKMDIKDGYLSLSGQVKEEKRDESKMGVSQSVMISSFQRTVPIPSNADTKNAKIEQKDKLLVITLPKK